jgi:hypothetical protein
MTGADRRPGPGGAAAATPPGWVAAASGGSALTARPLRWGFRHETWVVETVDGRSLVVQRRVDRSDPTEPRLRAVRAAVRAAGPPGWPVPEPTRVALEDGGVETPSPGALAPWWPLMLLERLAEAPDAAERGLWAARLAAALDHGAGNDGPMTPRRPRAAAAP